MFAQPCLGYSSAMTIRHLIVAFMLALLALPLAAPAAYAQDQAPRRSLFEVLFGNSNNQPSQPPATTQQRTMPQPQSSPRPQQQAPRPAPQASLPPAPAAVDKDEDATRIAVFGDSLAVDLAAAMNRFYAEDRATRVIGQGVGSSGFVRNDFFDWQGALDQAIANDSFDIAVVMVGINDRQVLGGAAALSEQWKASYSARIERFVNTLARAGKPFVWVELPPMERTQFSSDMAQISALHRSAVQSAGGEWVETFERYMSEAGNYTAVGPDLSGNIVSMRKGDGIHLSNAGSDKLAFFIDRAIRQHHTGSPGGNRSEVADLLAGTDAADMLRPPFQGLGQSRHFEMAGLVQQIGGQTRRANDLLMAGGQSAALAGFDLETMMVAPAGRVDAFGAVPEPALENRYGR